jgi:RNA polymerase sigma-70 factor (ECF subfamily)
MSNNNDEIIAALFQQGNKTAFKQVRKKYYGTMLTFARQLTNDIDEGRKIADNSFAKLEKMYEQFDTMKNIGAFLYITTKNNSLNYLKAKSRKPKTSTSLLGYYFRVSANLKSVIRILFFSGQQRLHHKQKKESISGIRREP